MLVKLIRNDTDVRLWNYYLTTYLLKVSNLTCPLDLWALLSFLSFFLLYLKKKPPLESSILSVTLPLK